MSGHVEEPKRFEPKKPVHLDPPKDDTITLEYLSKCDGTNDGFPTLVAIKGTVFDVSGNAAYGAKGQYHVFAGKEPNRALAQSSLKLEDCIAEWENLDDKEKGVLADWFTFFSKRYNIVGKLKPEGGVNL
ncbi:putative progesterone binding protein [Lophium mytilinum]|uniref:Putative progesterone binding protein n=1 Tax=Lophium mytilinum TaxID=390894 RepID=A0A6A6QJ10_9PEZI|nr:putative progesterone binding protein [Lophium mytilinum]